MTGWRIGFAVGNRDIIAALGKVKTNIDSGQFAAIQEAATVALNEGDAVRQARHLVQPGELRGALALVHHMEDFINKTVQADKGGQFRHPGRGDVQTLRALIALFLRDHHGFRSPEQAGRANRYQCQNRPVLKSARFGPATPRNRETGRAWRELLFSSPPPW